MGIIFPVDVDHVPGATTGPNLAAGTLFPKSKGARVLAPISGVVTILHWSEKRDDVLLDATIALKGKNGEMSFTHVDVPMPVPQQIEAGQLIGIAGSNLKWVVRAGKFIDPLSLAITTDPAQASLPSSGGGALLLIGLAGAAWWMKKRKKFR